MFFHYRKNRIKAGMQAPARGMRLEASMQDLPVRSQRPGHMLGVPALALQMGGIEAAPIGFEQLSGSANAFARQIGGGNAGPRRQTRMYALICTAIYIESPGAGGAAAREPDGPGHLPGIQLQQLGGCDRGTERTEKAGGMPALLLERQETGLALFRTPLRDAEGNLIASRHRRQQVC